VHPAKGCQSENERALSKKWCILARDVKKNCAKQVEHKTRAACTFGCLSKYVVWVFDSDPVCVAFIPEKSKEVLQTKLMAFSTKNVIIINMCKPIHVHD
jgi:hypothetical protein